jgi:hypothetical protein
MKTSTRKGLLKSLRHGRRLKTKAPRQETPKTVYTRKRKHKGRNEDSSLFLSVLQPRSMMVSMEIAVVALSSQAPFVGSG